MSNDKMAYWSLRYFTDTDNEKEPIIINKVKDSELDRIRKQQEGLDKLLARTKMDLEYQRKESR